VLEEGDMSEETDFEIPLTQYTMKDLYDTLILTTKTIAHYAKSLKEDSIPDPAEAAFFLSLDENLKDMWAVREELVRRRKAKQNLNSAAPVAEQSPPNS
jgi:hypothetical protein